MEKLIAAIQSPLCLSNFYNKTHRREYLIIRSVTSIAQQNSDKGTIRAEWGKSATC